MKSSLSKIEMPKIRERDMTVWEPGNQQASPQAAFSPAGKWRWSIAERAGLSYVEKKGKSRGVLKGNVWVVEGLCRSQLGRAVV